MSLPVRRRVAGVAGDQVDQRGGVDAAREERGRLGRRQIEAIGEVAVAGREVVFAVIDERTASNSRRNSVGRLGRRGRPPGRDAARPGLTASKTARHCRGTARKSAARSRRGDARPSAASGNSSARASPASASDSATGSRPGSCTSSRAARVSSRPAGRTGRERRVDEQDVHQRPSPRGGQRSELLREAGTSILANPPVRMPPRHRQAAERRPGHRAPTSLRFIQSSGSSGLASRPLTPVQGITSRCGSVSEANTTAARRHRLDNRTRHRKPHGRRRAGRSPRAPRPLTPDRSFPGHQNRSGSIVAVAGPKDLPGSRAGGTRCLAPGARSNRRLAMQTTYGSISGASRGEGQEPVESSETIERLRDERDNFLGFPGRDRAKPTRVCATPIDRRA